MTTEQMEELLGILDTLSTEDLATLAEAAKKKQSEKECALIRSAEQKFITAYKAFRALAPNHTKYLCWEYDNNSGNWEEQDFDLYAMLDAAIGERLF